MLHYLSYQWQLTPKIKAIHINHGLHIEADAWAAHCAAFCCQHQISYIIEKVTISPVKNIEEQARIARYSKLESQTTAASCVLTAHHQDDQAETLLLNLMRGTGIAGLSAMPESKKFGHGYLYRPLLEISRQELAAYAQYHQLSWINDPANQDLRFSRNFIRHQVLPLLNSRWTASKTLTRTSKLAQEAQENLDALAMIDYPELNQTAASVQNSNTLSLTTIYHLSEARIKNVIRLWLKQHHVRPLNSVTWQRLYHELIHAKQDGNPAIPWETHVLRRYQQRLYLTKERIVKPPKKMAWHHFPKPLTIPGIGIVHAKQSPLCLKLKPTQQIEIRLRHGGETFFWHGQHQSLKKLMQMWRIPPWERAFIPLLYINDELVGVIGYAMAEGVNLSVIAP